MHARGGVVFCPECGGQLGDEAQSLRGVEAAGRSSLRRPGDRGRPVRDAAWLEESPDTAGQDAGASQAAKADGKWHRKQTAAGVVLSGDAGGKGETVG